MEQIPNQYFEAIRNLSGRAQNQNISIPEDLKEQINKINSDI